MGVTQTLTVTLGLNVFEQVTLPFDRSAIVLASRIAFERSNRPFKLAGCKV